HEGAALTADRLGGAEVALEFTRPEAAPGNLMRIASLGLPIVSGTTGWSSSLPSIEREVNANGGALLHSPNFSVGVHLFLRAAADLARQFRGRDFDGFILEQHHAAKRDAPSGTALRLQSAVSAADPDRPFKISSIRAGFSPGTHLLAYDSPFEVIRLEHTARSRQSFAAGALMAAEWLQGRTGVYTFEDMLFGEAR
ncbi:MAG TPA: dihydrodipicolinate reductase C-terminal domain-containing protein, partial [Gemmatimonadales bacterium]|nr:dihydrodipicolinate reductase C-terminal domain-containing protein [Gemmatimonadales bacterium]